MPTVNFILSCGGSRHLYEGVDTDVSNYMDLCEAISQLALGREFDEKNMDLVVKHVIPGTQAREKVDGDKSYMAMVSRYGENDTINIHYSLISYIVDEPEIVYTLPNQSLSDCVEGEINVVYATLESGEDSEGIHVECDNVDPLPNIVKGPGLYGVDLGEGEDELFELSEDDREWEPCGDDDPNEACLDSLDVQEEYSQSSDDQLSNNDSDFEDLCKLREEDDDLSDFDKNDEYLMLHAYEDSQDGKVIFKRGQTFHDVNHFREKLVDYSVETGRVFRYLKNERQRVVAKCSHTGCTWTIRATPFPSLKSDNFVIKTLKGGHCCTRKTKNKWANAAWISRKLKKQLIDHPCWKMVNVRQWISTSLMLKVSYNKDPMFWPPSQCLPIEPPIVKRMPGRPKYARRREQGEGPTVKRKQSYTCSRCGGEGHTSRTCGKHPSTKRVNTGVRMRASGVSSRVNTSVVSSRVSTGQFGVAVSSRTTSAPSNSYSGTNDVVVKLHPVRGRGSRGRNISRGGRKGGSSSSLGGRTNNHKFPENSSQTSHV